MGIIRFIFGHETGKVCELTAWDVLVRGIMDDFNGL